MSKSYTFEFLGTKEDFLKHLNQLNKSTNNNQRYFYFNNYIVDFSDDKIRFGVERCGHSGGHWFIPTITESDGKTTFNGTLQYIGPEVNSLTVEISIFKKFIDKIGELLLYIILMPIVLVIYAFYKIGMFFEWVINKMLHRTTVKPKTTEEKMFDLMENYLKCKRQ